MHRHGLTWVVIFGVIALMFLQLPPMVAKQDAVVNTYRALVEVDALARQKYVEPIHDDRLVDGAIRGMMLQLDPYSGYIAPDELPAFQRQSRGEYIGIGVEVGVREGRLTVIAPIENSPAAKAGILAGDTILAVNGEDIKGLGVFDVDERLAGKPGTTVTLRTLHAWQSEPEDITVVRGPVSIKTIRGFRRVEDGRWDYLIDPERRIGYIRISNFHHNTTGDFETALRSLLDCDVRAIVLDLRFDPGGLMEVAVAMVDRFVDRGIIATTVTRRKAVQEYPATPRAVRSDLELAVLVNAGSASSSEIVAGSLQAHGRAVIVGERTFGKGSVQHLIDLQSHDAAIKLTVAHYCLPNGRIIHRTKANEHTDSWGILPDVEVSLDRTERLAIQESRRTLDTDFASAAGSGSRGATDPAEEPRDRPSSEIIRDRQLIAALSLLAERIRRADVAGR